MLREPASQPYLDLRSLIGHKDYFILSTNVDTQVEKTFPAERVCNYQGSFMRLQCKQPCCDELFDAGPCVERMLAGDIEARNVLVEHNLRLVAHIAKKYYTQSDEQDDLISIGTIGLIKAIDNFDSTLGVKFSTYAVPMIIGEIRRYLRDNNSIRVSRSLKDTAYKAIYAKDTLTRKNLKEPTVEEIAAEVGISKEDIVYALDAMQNPMSLYEPVYTDGGDTLYVMDQISDKKNKEEMWVEHLSLSEAMKRLNDRERHIISLRFFEGKTQTEVADMIGISQAQVSRLEKNALKAMRGYLTA